MSEPEDSDSTSKTNLKKTKAERELDKLRIDNKLPDIISGRRNPVLKTKLLAGDTGTVEDLVPILPNQNPPPGRGQRTRTNSLPDRLGTTIETTIARELIKETSEDITDDESDLNFEGADSELNTRIDRENELDTSSISSPNNLEIITEGLSRVNINGNINPEMPERRAELKAIAENWTGSGLSDVEIFRTLSDADLIILLEERVTVITDLISAGTDATGNTKIKESIEKQLKDAKEYSIKQGILRNIRNNASAPPFEKQNTFKTLHKEVGKFSGKSKEDYQQWLHDIVRSTTVLQLTDEETFEAVGWKLDGGPRETHRHFSLEKAKTHQTPKWSEFLLILNQRYTNSMRVDMAREKLLSLKMSNLGNDI